MFRGFGTVLNVATVLLGSGIGVLIGSRLPERTRDVVTDGLGLVTLLVAALNIVSVVDGSYVDAVGSGATVLIVLGAILVGGIVGSLLHLEARLEQLGEFLRTRLTRLVVQGLTRWTPRRFVEGFVAASLTFCVGPLTVLGSLSDGLGRGADQLALKAVLDGFASIAFAAAFGWGVAASAITVLVVQGGLTAIAFLLGDLLPAAQISALTATGGLLLVGVALRLLRIKAVPVADLMPALIVAPALTALVVSLR